MEKSSLAVQFGVGDDGQIIFKANAIREPPYRTARADEVPELPGAVQRGRIVINVIVDFSILSRSFGHEKTASEKLTVSKVFVIR